MRQETGSNNPTKDRVVSIRVTSDGHNFSGTHIESSAGEVTLLIESFKAMLIPTYLLEELSPVEHLRSGGIGVDVGSEGVIVVQHNTSVTALIVLPTSLLSQIDKAYGNRAKFTTPLLLPSIGRSHEVLLHLSDDEGLLTMNIYNGGDLIFAEIFEVKSREDVLYWLTRVGEGYDLSTYIIYTNSHDKDLERLLKRYYKQIEVCE